MDAGRIGADVGSVIERALAPVPGPAIIVLDVFGQPFLMELDDAIPLFIKAIEKKKRFSAFPWQLATIVRAGKFMPAWLYDRIAGKARYRE